MEYNKTSIKEEWLEGNLNHEFIDWAEGFGKHLAQKRNGKNGTELTTNQLRKFFGAVKRQQTKGYDATEFAFLRPQLAYSVAKAKNREGKIHDFFHVMAGAMERVTNKERFKNFIKIFEAIVAYHKAAEVSNLELSNTKH